MSEPVNLRQARKAKARREKESAAEAARAKHGQTKAEKKLRAGEDARAAKHLDAHKREDD